MHLESRIIEIQKLLHSRNKKQGLVSLGDLRNPEQFSDDLSESSLYLSRRLNEIIFIELADNFDNELLNDLISIDRVFTRDLRYSRNEFRRKMRNQDVGILIARTEVKPIAASLNFFQTKGEMDFFYCDEFAVVSQYQNKGIGKVLMNLNFLLAHQLDYSQMFLYCQDKSKEGINLQQYYESLGFYFAGKNYDGTKMQKPIEPQESRAFIQRLNVM